jgi:hypothetical protein
MDHCNLDHLNLKDLKAVCKYYKIDHASRVKRVELEALIYMAEHVHALTIIHVYNNNQPLNQPLGKVEPNCARGTLPAVEPNQRVCDASQEEEGMQVMDIVPDTSSNSP